jgi:hypothetical protein
MSRKRKIVLALASPFTYWLLLQLAVAISGHPCDPGPPQPTWECRLQDFSGVLFWTSEGWILGFLVNHDIGPKDSPLNFPLAVAWFVSTLILVYLLWALIVYFVMHLFASIHRRISN